MAFLSTAPSSAATFGESDRIIALAGNPNVGKSTVFNMLTGLNQHTGNWPGKTVASARGMYRYEGSDYILVDLPGTYSLMASSQEEEIARDFLLFNNIDACVVVCDATCLERNLNLALQTAEITENTVLCLNLMDEAERKGIHIDTGLLEKYLGIPVAATSARSGQGLKGLTEKVRELIDGELTPVPVKIGYPEYITQTVKSLAESLGERNCGGLNAMWLALRLLEGDDGILESIKTQLGIDLSADPVIMDARREAAEKLAESGITQEAVRDITAGSIVMTAEKISSAVITRHTRADRDRRLDRVLTSRVTGIPIMLILLCCVFWLTISGANYPSALLSKGLFWLEGQISNLFIWLRAPDWLHGVLVLGVYRVLAWVVSVMLPPMAIFFTIFTFLEDFGYLPRVAFNLDRQFKKAHACGKQALTMCMGFGCNAAGVTGCRIIDSPREKLIAILTNNFVPCNGRFPMLISVAAIFFAGSAAGLGRTLLSTVVLAAVIVLGVALTFLVSRILSTTVLKGEPSSFALELPPYRTPLLGKVIVRSMLDRTLFVLARAVQVAAPAGLLIWILANVHIGGSPLLSHCSAFLDPFAQLLGMDGVILLAFILGFPANEIVIPIIIMAYMSTGSLTELESMSALRELLEANGWTWVTAISVTLFCLLHWPCSTACLTIKKETGSVKWTAAAILIPTITGILACFIFTAMMRLAGFR